MEWRELCTRIRSDLMKHIKGASEVVVVATSFMIAIALTHSIPISGALACISATFLYFNNSARNRKEQSLIQSACPDLLDQLITGIRSGLSLNESLTSLADRGPEILKPYFAEFREEIYSHGNFEIAIQKTKEAIHNPSADQIFEALILARSLGGTELMNLFRTLGEFIRQDLTLRREIEVKQGWIKNSAHLSASAPWILLLLLSTQPSTASAYSTPTGILILLAGLAATFIAYIWMGFLSKMPEPPRIFGEE